MRIGIDIDDVITDTSEIIEEFVLESANKQKLLGHMKDIMKGTPSEPEVVSFCLENYLRAFERVKPKNNVSEVIRRLMGAGNEIYLITARGEKIEFFRGSEAVTVRFLEKHNIDYTKIIFNAMDKARICLDNQIDVMVDDSVEHCEDVKRVGIESIVFNSEVNKNTPTTIERVGSWLELEEKIIQLFLRDERDII